MAGAGQADENLLNFPFEGPDWSRQWTLLVIALGLAGLFVPPLASMLAMGLGGQIAKVVIAGGRPALPDRLDWRALLSLGARWWLVSMLFQLPALAAAASTAGWLLWRYGLPRLGEEWGGLPEAWPVIAGGLGLALPLGLLGAWLSNIAQMQVSAGGSARSALRLGWWGWVSVLRANFGGFMGVLGRMLLLGLGVGTAQFAISLPAAPLIFVPGLLGVISGLYLRCISAALYARAYRDGLRRLEARSNDMRNPGG